MGFFRSSKKFIGKGWNVSGWLQLTQLKQERELIKSLIKDVSKKNKASKSQAQFNQIVEDKQYTEQDINLIKNKSKRTFWAYIGLSFVLLAYITYLFAQNAILSGICSIPMYFALLAFAFKESFFLFCLNQKSFDQTLQNWINHFFYHKGDA